ncbi:MAG: UbiA family prenyltransferase [Phycisphaerales bacterium]
MFSWLELMRLSNAPTVASNVLAGVAVGMLARLSGINPPLDTMGMLLLGVLLVYAAGMMLNDACDVSTDRVERPGRPIPSGRIPRKLARNTAVVMLAAGTTVLVFAGEKTLPWALLLGSAVLLYDTLHRQIPLSWLLLALCRGTVIVVSALAVSPGSDWPVINLVGGGLFLYVAALSAAARDEMRGMGKAALVGTLAVPLLTLWPAALLLLDIPRPDNLSLAAGLGVLGGIALPSAVLGTRNALMGRQGVPAAVGLWLGTIPVMDAAVCFLLGQPWLGVACLGLWGAAGALRPRIAAS